MAKLYVRVDDRLIHGQTIVAWCPTLEIKEIIAVDDISAKNPMLKNILTMGVPSAYKTHIVTTEEAQALLRAPGAGNRLLIVKRPERLAALEAELAGAEAVVLGNLAKQPDSTHKLDGATGIFFLSDSDIAILDKIAAKGIEVSFHQLPTTTKTSWDSFKKTI